MEDIKEMEQLVHVLINQIQATQQTQQIICMELKRINERIAKLEEKVK